MRAGNARLLPREAVSMRAGILRGHGLQRACFPARGGPRGARARLLGRGCAHGASCAAGGSEAARRGGECRRECRAQHAPRCNADARYLLVDPVPVFRDADARSGEDRPARYGGVDKGSEPLGGQPCPPQRFGVRPCAGTAQGRRDSSSRIHYGVNRTFRQRHAETAGREAPAASAQREAARGLDRRRCKDRVQHSGMDVGLLNGYPP